MMIDEQRELNREKWRRRNLERLGFADPRCLFCGESDPRCLERDHIAGRAHSDDMAVLCANCHRVRPDLQKDHPPKIAAPEERCEVIARFLEGLADFLELIVTRLREYGPFLSALAAASVTATAATTE